MARHWRWYLVGITAVIAAYYSGSAYQFPLGWWPFVAALTLWCARIQADLATVPKITDADLWAWVSDG